MKTKCTDCGGEGVVRIDNDLWLCLQCATVRVQFPDE